MTREGRFAARSDVIASPLKCGPGWSAGRRVVPESAVFEDRADEVWLVALDEGDDLPGPAALGAEERSGLIDVLDEGCPTAAVQWAGRRRSAAHLPGSSGE